MPLRFSLPVLVFVACASTLAAELTGAGVMLTGQLMRDGDRLLLLQAFINLINIASGASKITPSHAMKAPLVFS